MEKYIPKDEMLRIDKAIQTAIESKSTVELEHRKLIPEHRSGWALMRAVPVLNEQNQIMEWLGAASDISARKKSEVELLRSEERFRLLSESGLIAIAFFNEDGFFTEANAAFYRETGFNPQDLVNAKLNFELLTPESSHKKLQLAMQQFAKEGFFAPYEQEYIKGDSSTGWALFGAARFNNNQDGLLFMLDISELKALEFQKDSLIGIASHELKTPVSSMLVYCEILEERLNGPDQSENLQMTKKMKAQIDRLGNLIRNLLDVTKIDEDGLKLTMAGFDINEQVKDIVGDFQRMSPGHTIHLELKSNGKVVADKEAIAQVLTNLIHNAIKYSPKGGKIEIRSDDLDSEIKVSIEDEGIGIPRKFMGQVFDRFFRINNDSLNINTFPGIGLGLFISASIIKKHGGKIAVESIENKGSIFYFTLPVKMKTDEKYFGYRG
jgi:two-component system CheB/CheR fusion protein